MVAVLFGASNLAAQWPNTTSSFLPADHWSHRVLRRLEVAGLLPAGSDIGRSSIPQEETAALLMVAAGSDTTGLAASYLHRFREEFTAREAGRFRLHGSVLGMYRVDRDQVRAGIGYDTVWTGARLIDDESDADGLIRTDVGSRHLAGAVAATSDGVEELQVVLATGAVGIWGGRRQIGYATPAGAGILMNRARLDGIGVFLTRPLRVPLFGHLRFELHGAKIDNVLGLNGTEQAVEPWLLTGRASLQPHARVTIGMNRGMIFGGEGNLPVTAERLLRNLAGFSTDEGEYSFANQVASLDVRYRPPTGAVPLVVYLEWGTEDLSGAWWRVPGISAGVEISAMPRQDVSVGLERTEFKRNRFNSHWYQNAWFRGGWADDGMILGHPLAGHGVEWRLFASGGSARGITADAAVYRRHRRAQNLFAPERRGSSAGGVVNAEARLTARIRLQLSGDVEHGGESDWTAARARVGARLLF
jgi:hypothetical protein